MKTIDTTKLDDDKADRVRRSHAEAIREIQARPALGMIVIPNVVLADNVRTTIAHGLGRAPSWIGPSVISGAATAGVIVEFVDGVDRTKVIDIAAVFYGATITIDLLVVP